MVCRMRSSGAGPNKVARELALDLSEGSFRPGVFEHTPGICNVIPDALSRKFQPGTHFVLPEALWATTETVLQARSSSFFRATAPPA